MELTRARARLWPRRRTARKIKSPILALGLAFLAAAALFGQGTGSGRTTNTGLGPDASGNLPMVSQPPWPKVIPPYTQVDPATGLHMTGTPKLVSSQASGSWSWATWNAP